MNVLIVDDEEYVLDFLESDIPWGSLGVKQVFRAQSADEALQHISLYPIPIVISDIRMPERDGIELITEILERDSAVKVILLSGHSDFEYAKQALKLGASDYLLKPATVEEITDCLSKVIEQFQEEKQQKENLIVAREVLQLGASRMREHVLLDLLLGKKLTQKEQRRHLNALNIKVEENDLCFLALLRIETGLEEMAREDYELFSYALLNMTEEIINERVGQDPSLWSCKDPHRFIVALLPVQTSQDYEAFVRKWERLQREVRHFFKQNRTVSIFLTSIFPFGQGIHQRYTEAVNDFWLSIGTQRDVLHTADQSQEKRAEKSLKPLSRLHLSPTIQQLMDTANWNEIPERLDFILDELILPDFHTQHHLLEVAYYLFGCFSYIAHKQGDSFADMVSVPVLENGSLMFQSPENIKEWGMPLIDQFQRSLRDVTINQNHIVKQIQDFVEQHLHDDVSLNRLGGHVYLHPVYLSRLYKKKTGESLSAYILRCRMEKAAQLLTTTNMRVADIATEVGYQKTQYFIHIFKDSYGCTPQVFRNR
ncbi:response regulator [Paenibacillus roseipurpureus]|uniref:Response regulator n=1 Tax=Paenibacillus roseopurpureus TaxID=2918901 RepID=A0AA96RJ37_9BACL|nr:response regulator [Paenibacillus sp. MBLB1832]WNR42889.1 response regulator [Paenibacillus sp. MBLB1832]